MKSSNIEKIFNYNPTVEDTKSLSPLTFYQPFQSSFDPEFTMPLTKTVNQQNLSQTPDKKWSQGSERTENGSMTPRSFLNPWEETIPCFNPDNQFQSPGYLKAPYAILGRSTSGWKNDPDRRTITRLPLTTSWPNMLSISPNRRQTLPGIGEDQALPYSIPEERSFGMLPQYSPKGSFGNEAAFGSNSNRPLYGSFDGYRFGTSFAQLSQISPGHDGSSSSSAYRPTANQIGKTQNLYKTGYNRPMVCNFCKNNKEVPDIYLNHYLYDPETKVLTCPVLRKHVCEICGGTGDRAHTLQYCPVNREKGLQAKVPVLLKTRTITNSTGKIRRN